MRRFAHAAWATAAIVLAVALAAAIVYALYLQQDRIDHLLARLADSAELIRQLISACANAPGCTIPLTPEGAP